MVDKLNELTTTVKLINDMLNKYEKVEYKKWE